MHAVYMPSLCNGGVAAKNLTANGFRRLENVSIPPSLIPETSKSIRIASFLQHKQTGSDCDQNWTKPVTSLVLQGSFL